MSNLQNLRKPRFQWSVFAEYGIVAVSSVAILAVILIFVFVFREASPLLFDAKAQEEVSLNTMFVPQVFDEEEGPASVWQPVSDTPKYGVWPLVTATLKVSLLSVLIAFPIGFLGAIFSAEFAPRRVREFIKPAVEMLAGIPSVVIGFFALLVLATWLQELTDWDYRLNAMVASLAMSIAVIPIIYTVCEDALMAVPKSIREASLALGATKLQTAFRTVVPAALPGIFGAVVLGVGRVIGETMVVLMAAGNAAVNSLSPLDPVRTLSASIAAEMAEVVSGSPHYNVLFVLGILLLLFTSAFNWLGDFIMTRFLRKVHGHG